MPKLFQINTFCNTGSTGRIAELLGETVMSHGWDSYIAYGRNANNSSSVKYKVGNLTDILVHGILTRLFDYQGLGSVKATRNLISYIKKVEPDIIHLHNLHGYYLNYPVLFEFLKYFGKPIVWTLHDNWAFTGHCTYFSYINCKKWETECVDCKLKKTYPCSMFRDNSANNYRLKKKLFLDVPNVHIVTVSKWLEGQVKKSFLKNSKIHQIYNGLDIEAFAPLKDSKNHVCKIHNIPDEKKIVLGVANVWTEYKGLYIFHELSKIINSDYQIILVGLSRKQVKELPPNIIGIERTQSVKELVQYYTAADVYFNASKHETLGMTSLEAQACGTPAIVYNSTGCPETITKNSGICLNDCSINDVCEAIYSLCNIPKDNISGLCRSNVTDNFNEKERYNEYYRLYESLL